MERVSTKDRILEAALDLFSEKGYDGVGVDMIAQSIGLKGPSIYKHFKGKEDILRSLMEKVDDYYSRNFGSSDNVGMIPSSMEDLVEASMRKVEFTMHDTTIRKIRKLTTIEQFRDPKIAEIATRHSVAGLQRMYSRILGKMMENGTVRQDDPDMLALQIVAPVTLMIQVCDRQPQYEKQCMKTVEEHLRHFAKNYAKENEYE